jgi:hypothetical protein
MLPLPFCKYVITLYIRNSSLVFSKNFHMNEIKVCIFWHFFLSHFLFSFVLHCFTWPKIKYIFLCLYTYKPYPHAFRSTRHPILKMYTCTTHMLPKCGAFNFEFNLWCLGLKIMITQS